MSLCFQQLTKSTISDNQREWGKVARKLRSVQEIAEEEYWDKRLQKEGLGMDRAAGRPWLSYGHDHTRNPNRNKVGGGRRIPKLPSLSEIEEKL